MRSTFLLCGVLGAVATASECQADENSLLQAKTSVRKHAQADSQAVLKKMRDVANSLLEGSDSTMTSDEVNDALQQASDALAQLSPAIQQQIANVQQQIHDAASAVQVCHAHDQAEVRSNLRDYVQRREAAVESCQDTLSHFRADETRQCGIAEDCLCDEARQRTTDQEALCASMLETYEAAFCEHHRVCTTFHQCHADEAEVFARMRADAEAEMAIVVQEYIAVEQSQCITGLIMQAMTPPITPIPHADLIACDNVDVSALRINYPNLPAEPAACPAHQHGEPECVAGGPWTLVLQYGEEAYPMNAGAVGVLNEDVNGFAKLSDEAINALPSGGEAGFDYYMLTSDPPDNGASDSTTAWDTMFLRTSNVGGFNDMDNKMGIVSSAASWGVCNAASLDECTTASQWSTQSHNRFDTSQTTGNNCNRWFTGYNGVKCYAYGGHGHNRNNRCFSRGAGCTDGRHRLRTNVKVYKLTGR